MNLEKAIEILTDILRHVKPEDPPDEHAAINLGIEALKRIQHNRPLLLYIYNEKLRGETGYPEG